MRPSWGLCSAADMQTSNKRPTTQHQFHFAQKQWPQTHDFIFHIFTPFQILPGGWAGLCEDPNVQLC